MCGVWMHAGILYMWYVYGGMQVYIYGIWRHAGIYNYGI